MIVASNGMLTGGRVVGHLRNLIDDPTATILFVGYQGEGTLGAHLQAGASEVKLDGQVRRVRCQVRSISGFSAHADESELLDWLRPVRRRQAAGRPRLPAPGLPRPRRPGGAGRARAEGPRPRASRPTSRTGTSASRSTERPMTPIDVGLAAAGWLAAAVERRTGSRRGTAAVVLGLVLLSAVITYSIGSSRRPTDVSFEDVRRDRLPAMTSWVRLEGELRQLPGDSGYELHDTANDATVPVS